ncbi:MAG TPA: hypothetical protein VGO40_18895 [Longimicrobium sp.]|jgi:hypothetical protein|nr:hypothetical protein [Longimicrobium sp.]
MGTLSEPSCRTAVPASAMSLADIFEQILKDWGKFCRFILLWICTLALLVLTLRLLPWITRGTGLRAKSVELSTFPRIILEQETRDGNRYLIVVQPQSWQDSGIPVDSGDVIKFKASGMVNISAYSVQENVGIRRRIERRLDVARAAGAFGDVADSLWLPERYYTQADRDSLSRVVPWVGPEGDTSAEGVQDRRYQARTRNKVLPNSPFGALVAAVRAGSSPPSRYDGFSGAFVVGPSMTRPWNGSPGTLWFTVNDVSDDRDRLSPEKFYIDNIGFFVVGVTTSGN